MQYNWPPFRKHGQFASKEDNPMAYDTGEWYR